MKYKNLTTKLGKNPAICFNYKNCIVSSKIIIFFGGGRGRQVTDWQHFKSNARRNILGIIDRMIF